MNFWSAPQRLSKRQVNHEVTLIQAGMQHMCVHSCMLPQMQALCPFSVTGALAEANATLLLGMLPPKQGPILGMHKQACAGQLSLQHCS